MYNPFFPSRKIYQNWQSIDKAFTDWLYGDWNKDKYDQFAKLYAIPFLSNYIDYKLDVRADNEYLNRYDMDYTDIHDPRKLRQTSSAARLYSSAYHMVSRNIDRLYK